MAEAKNEEVTDSATQEDDGNIPRRIRSEKYVSLYTNQAELGFTSWDIQMSLYQIHGQNETLMAEEIASILMSPQHAKALIVPLINTVAQYERKHGIIQMAGNKPPQSILETLLDAVEKFKALKAAKEAEAAAGGRGEAEGQTPAAE